MIKQTLKITILILFCGSFVVTTSCGFILKNAFTPKNNASVQVPTINVTGTSNFFLLEEEFEKPVNSVVFGNSSLKKEFEENPFLKNIFFPLLQGTNENPLACVEEKEKSNRVAGARADTIYVSYFGNAATCFEQVNSSFIGIYDLSSVALGFRGYLSYACPSVDLSNLNFDGTNNIFSQLLTVCSEIHIRAHYEYVNEVDEKSRYAGAKSSSFLTRRTISKIEEEDGSPCIFTVEDMHLLTSICKFSYLRSDLNEKWSNYPLFGTERERIIEDYAWGEFNLSEVKFRFKNINNDEYSFFPSAGLISYNINDWIGEIQFNEKSNPRFLSKYTGTVHKDFLGQQLEKDEEGYIENSVYSFERYNHNPLK